MNLKAIILGSAAIACSHATQIQLEFSGKITNADRYFPFAPPPPNIVAHAFTGTLTYDSNVPPTDLLGWYSIPGSNLTLDIDGYVPPGGHVLPPLQLAVSPHGITWFGGAGLFMAYLELQSDFPFDTTKLPDQKITITGGSLSLSEPGWYYAYADIFPAQATVPEGGTPSAVLLGFGLASLIVARRPCPVVRV